MHSPDKLPPGAIRNLRFSVLGEVADELMVQLTDIHTRQTLPGFLNVFSDATHIYQPDDYIDGISSKEVALGHYVRRVDDYNRHRFNGSPGVYLEDRLLHMNIRLGVEIAKRLLVPPFYEPSASETIGVNYMVPGTQPIDMKVVEDIEAYMSERPRAVYDELTVVSDLTAKRSLYVRTRDRSTVRPSDDILQV